MTRSPAFRRSTARALRRLAGLIDDRRGPHPDDLPCRCGARQSVHRPAHAGGCTHCSCPGFRLDTAAAEALTGTHRSESTDEPEDDEPDEEARPHLYDVLSVSADELNLGPRRAKPWTT